MQRFGSAAMDETEAAHYCTTALSRIMPTTANSTTTHTMRLQRSTLGKLPDDQFRQAAGNAVAQMPQQQRAGLLDTLMGALGGAGAAGGIGGLVNMLGLGTSDPNQMSADDAAKLMNYARKEQPQVFSKPWRRSRGL